MLTADQWRELERVRELAEGLHERSGFAVAHEIDERLLAVMAEIAADEYTAALAKELDL